MNSVPERRDDEPPGAKVSVVVVAYNSEQVLGECLRCLARQSEPAFECIVVDNASAGGPPDALMPDDDRFRLVALERNAGFAAANNIGADVAAGDFIVTLNPDAFVSADFLARLLAAAEQNPAADMFGCTLLAAGDSARLDGAGDNLSIFGIPWRGGHGRKVPDDLPDLAEVFGPCAAAAMYRRAAFERVGGFDASFFCYLEDVDLAYRLRLAGGRCLHVGRGLVRHVGAASTGGVDASADYFGARNAVFLAVKNTPAALMPVVLPCLFLGLTGLFVKAVVTGRPGAVLRGVIAGIRGGRDMWRRRHGVRRTVPAGRIASALTWNPVALVTRRVVLRPWQ